MASRTPPHPAAMIIHELPSCKNKGKNAKLVIGVWITRSRFSPLPECHDRITAVTARRAIDMTHSNELVKSRTMVIEFIVLGPRNGLEEIDYFLVYTTQPL